MHLNVYGTFGGVFILNV